MKLYPEVEIIDENYVTSVERTYRTVLRKEVNGIWHLVFIAKKVLIQHKSDPLTEQGLLNLFHAEVYRAMLYTVIDVNVYDDNTHSPIYPVDGDQRSEQERLRL